MGRAFTIAFFILLQSAAHGVVPEKSKTSLFCETTIRRLAFLAPLLSEWQRKASAVPADFALVLGAKPEQCIQHEKRKPLLDAIAQIYGDHNKKIGIFVTISSRFAKEPFLQGLRNALQDRHLEFEQIFQVYDASSTGAVRQSFADAVFKDRIAAVWEIVADADDTWLKSWTRSLMIPLVLLREKRPNEDNLKNIFSFYPQEQNLAEALRDAALARGFQRIGVLAPASRQGFVDAFRTAADGRIQVSAPAYYEAGNYDSMTSAANQVFRTDRAGREDDYQSALAAARRKAAHSGQPFDGRFVILKPIIDFDALLLPDHFLNVRHLVKFMQYLGVPKLPLLGTMGWRSSGLVSPPEPFLDGSLFADFVGLYAQLPKSFAPLAPGDGQFADDNHETLDFQIIGYAGGEAAAALQSAFAEKRFRLTRLIMNAKISGSSFFADGRLFDDKGNVNWPGHTFQVADKSIHWSARHVPKSVNNTASSSQP